MTTRTDRTYSRRRYVSDGPRSAPTTSTRRPSSTGTSSDSACSATPTPGPCSALRTHRFSSSRETKPHSNDTVRVRDSITTRSESPHARRWVTRWPESATSGSSTARPTTASPRRCTSPTRRGTESRSTGISRVSSGTTPTTGGPVWGANPSRNSESGCRRRCRRPCWDGCRARPLRSHLAGGVQGLLCGHRRIRGPVGAPIRSVRVCWRTPPPHRCEHVPPRSGPVGGRGLSWFEVLLPDTAALDALRERFASSRIPVTETDGGIVVSDPDGIEVRFRVET